MSGIIGRDPRGRSGVLNQFTDVGLNTSLDSEWHSSMNAIQINSGSLSAHDAYPHYVQLNANVIQKDSGEKRVNDSYKASQHRQWDGEHIFRVAPAAGGDISWVTAMSINNNGEVTMPVQPAFHAFVSSDQNTPAAGDTVEFDDEMFDIGANFNEGTNTFTADVAGKYLFNVRLRLATVDNNSNYLVFYLATTGQTYNYLFGLGGADGGDFPYWAVAFSCIANMVSSHTAKVTYRFSGGTTVGAINSGAEYAEFSGYLLG